MADIQLQFGDMEDDDSFDPSDLDPGAVGLLFGAILARIISERRELSSKERLALALILLVERLGREGSI